jgi:hypothetical protein
MTEPLIPGGYLLLSRKLIESEIWNKPPLYIKIWVYLLAKAQHSQYKGLSKGQLRTSIPEIMEDCSWHVGFRKVTPTKDQVYQVLAWLRNPTGKNSRNPYESNDESNTKATMITTTKATHGLIINIVNYCLYQDPKNYESNDEGNNETVMNPTREQRAPNNINKNVKNDKNLFIMSQSQEQFINTLKTIPNYNVDLEKDIAMYERLEKRYPELDIIKAIEGWAVYKLDKPLTEKSNPRSQINTAFGNYVKWGKYLKEQKEQKDKPKPRNRFHNFEQPYRQMSNEELKAILNKHKDA